MGDTGAATSPVGDGRGGSLVFQNGVWLTKGRTDRVDKYQKWAETQVKCEVERLDKEEHESLVKLNGQCLEVRTELRGLKKERRQIQHRRQRSSDSAQDTADASTSPTSTVTALHKSHSSGSLTSYSSGYSSLGSATSGGRRSRGVEVDKGGEGSGARRKSPGLPTNRNTRDLSATRVKAMHSARALSKLKNKLEVYI